MLVLKSKRYNIDAVLKLIILVGFALFFFVEIHTGKVKLFVHPRIIPYLKFGIAAMLLIAVFIFADIFKPQRKKVNLVPYLFFIIPLIMAFVIPAKAMTSSSMSFGAINLTGKTGMSASSNSSQSSSADSASTVSTADGSLQDNTSDPNGGQNTYNASTDNSTPEIYKLKLKDNTVFMNDNNFVQWLMEIYDKPEQYYGKKIEVIGFVFKDSQFKPNEFVPARLMMVCCAADLQPEGLLCTYPKAAQLNKDSWVKVSGTIEKYTYQGGVMPVIAASDVRSAAKPMDEYVYPY